MRKLILGLALVAVCLPALADDKSDFRDGALVVLQQQRNDAMDQLVNAQARAAMVSAQFAAAQKRIAELEAAAPKDAPK